MRTYLFQPISFLCKPKDQLYPYTRKINLSEQILNNKNNIDWNR